MLTWASKHVFFPLWEIKDGAHRAKYLRALQATQWLDGETLRQRQWARLREVVAYAATYCPYYKANFGTHGSTALLRDSSDFQRLPILTKFDIRKNADALLSVQFRRDDLVLAKTGGSTGVALQVYFDKKCQELRNAAAMRSDMWAGWDIGMSVAAVWGNPPVADTLKKKLRNLLLDRTIYLDTMAINNDSVRRFVDAWRRTGTRILFGHSHSLYVLASFLRRLDIDDIRPLGVISTSMMLLASERKVIEDVFACPVTDRYGCEEVSLIAAECERHEGLHINVDHVVVEFLRDDGTNAPPGEEANIVVTDLINRGMPLIRYRIEDLGISSDRACSCGRGLPLMERVTGRTADFLKRQDGSLVAGVSLVERTLTAISGIEQLQLIQNDPATLQVNVVKDPTFTNASEEELVKELQTVFGRGMAIYVRYPSELQRTKSGKYRFAICNI